MIKGKSIFILLGGSGVGKSTTIHYLAESEMIETEIEGLTHIGPFIVTNPQA
jgi:putative ribosome biogenesis GTPase RsgA